MNGGELMHGFGTSRRRTFRFRLFLALGLALVLCGCGKQTGPPRYSISGKVTYGGKPVPGGRLLFVPDSERGNAGPGSVAEIKDGRYSTRAQKGAIDGPHRVTIYGTDGTVATAVHDNTLFDNYSTTVEVPAKDATIDFEIPVQP